MLGRLWKRRAESGDERRRHPRHEIDVATTCRAVALNREMPARIKNVSRSGVNLEIGHAVPEGTMIRIDLPGPVGGHHVEILACVTHCRGISGDKWSVGCRFSIDLCDAEMRLLGGEKRRSEPSDQRAWVRFPAKGTVDFNLVASDDAHPKTAQLVDLSPAGVGLLVDERLEPGQAISLVLRRTGNKPDRTMLACVVYLTDRSDGKFAAGCNFIHVLSDKELNELVWRSSV